MRRQKEFRQRIPGITIPFLSARKRGEKPTTQACLYSNINLHSNLLLKAGVFFKGIQGGGQRVFALVGLPHIVCKEEAQLQDCIF